MVISGSHPASSNMSPPTVQSAADVEQVTTLGLSAASIRAALSTKSRCW